MEAILWDGNKKLFGEIEFLEAKLCFSLSDFSQSNLNLEIKYSDILEVNHYKLFNIINGGIEIICKDGRKNVFVIEDTKLIRQKLTTNINITNQLIKPIK